MSNTALIFSNKGMGYRKTSLWKKTRFFSVDYVKINKLHVVHTWLHM